jgi:hypothetical protein
MGLKYVANSPGFFGGARRIAMNTQRICAYVYHISIAGCDLPVLGKAHGLGRRNRQVLVHGPGLLARNQGAIGLIRAIYECFGDEPETMAFRGGLKLRVGHPDERRLARGFRGNARNDVSKVPITNRVVVKGPVGFDVSDSHAHLRRRIGKRRDLLRQ